jgi:type IV pilus assembly protein PilO
MTYADDEFMAVEGQDDGPSYPTAFGITFTPRVGGIVIGVAGLLGALYLLMNAVQPAWEKYQSLDSEVKSQEAQIKDQAKIQEEIAQAQKELDQAKLKNQQVLSLFPNQKTLDTLLLDLNNPVKLTRGELTGYEPITQEAQAGGNENAAPVPGNGKLQRKTYNIALEGNFDQVQSIMRSFERLQSLLVVRDFKSELNDQQVFLINDSGQATPAFIRKDTRSGGTQARPTLKTTFKLDALVPTSAIEAAQADKADQAAKAQTKKTKK